VQNFVPQDLCTPGIGSMPVTIDLSTFPT